MMYLLLAITSEVAGTLLLRVASFGRRVLFIPVALLYVVSYLFLGLTLQAGMPVGIAYALWAAIGLVVTTMFSRLLFGEHISRRMAVGLVLIIAGVFLVELG